METYTVAASGAGERLDMYLTDIRKDLSRSHAQKLIENKHVLVNEKSAKDSFRLRPGDVISLELPPPRPLDLTPEDIPLDIVYEDDDFMVINKPAGMTVHPAPGHYSGTLVNAVLAHCPSLQGIGDVARPGIVHRLDKDTSGLILVAKTDKAHQNLSRQFKDRRIKKAYTALVKGVTKDNAGVIDAPIARDPANRKRMAIVHGGRYAVTEWSVLKRFQNATLVEARPLTGRTHQIRIHFAHKGHPLFGDAVYGGPMGMIKRQFLHASRLEMRLPTSGEMRTFTCPLPEDLEEALGELRPT